MRNESKLMLKIFHLIPTPGHVLGIFHRSGSSGRSCHFKIGYCRGASIAGHYVVFEHSFRRGISANLLASWVEPVDFGFLLLKDLTFDLVQDADWMRSTNGGKINE